MLQGRSLGVVLALGVAQIAFGGEASEGATSPAKISFSRQVVPILQANCHGCHQPAKAGGEYVMASFGPLKKGGESGETAVVPGRPAESNLVAMITPKDGEAAMPQGKQHLVARDVELIRRWIEEGAVDDTPENVQSRVDAEHPPVYARPPVISSLDFSPDGRAIAVAGFHEVILMQADGSTRLARLVGLSERIESVRFSPDGTRLAVSGGLPCRMGELQVWDVAQRKLALSLPATYDTIYGGSWSPDGRRIAFGASDNAVRAVDVVTGEQELFMAAHEDWVRSTTFSGDGKSIFSASRDMTVKMTDVATQRFVGNVTTHTPGVLRGGMLAIERHPKRDEVLVGTSDGAPKLFRMDVKAAPASGGNPNQIREYASMPGRVFDVRFQPDGARLFAASSLDGRGHVWCYEAESGKVVWKAEIEGGGMYALACSPEATTLAAAGADGRIRLLDAASGQVGTTFLPVEITPQVGRDVTSSASPKAADETSPNDATVKDAALVRLEVEPGELSVSRFADYAQILLTGVFSDGTRGDLTHRAKWSISGGLGQVSAEGRFTPERNGSGRIIGEFVGHRVEIPVKAAGLDVPHPPDFLKDVNPILSRLGCNQGTCHGAAKGKNGFKLSLRGYDARWDVRSLTDDLASRRINAASPDNSLMLLKATASVPHQGGQLITRSSPYYQILRQWIADGARLNLGTSRVSRIELFPRDPVVQRIGESQRMRVVATYADGSTRDVTREAFIESGNTEVAAADRDGRIVAVRRGEAPVLARYEGAYAATTLTVMGNREGFVWQSPETWGRVDELVAAKWQRIKLSPSPLCTDDEFLRRVYLDLVGLPPTADGVASFASDPRDARTKRGEVIDRLTGSTDYVEHWTNKWADLLQVNRKHLGAEGAAEFRKWIRGEVAANTPYDEFVRKILTATGSNREHPAASYFKILRDPLSTVENTTHLFLAVRFNCNRCHDHPFERWTQDQYYQTAAYFARFELKPDPASGDRKIEGSAVQEARALYELVLDKTEGEVVHDRTQAATPPQFPFACRYSPQGTSRRNEFAAWLTSPDNPYFARSYVNRMWGYLLGVGLIEPIDDIRAGNPPSNPELLNYLTQEFVASGFNVRHIQRLVCRSRTYQLSVESNVWNQEDRVNYSHALARRLPAEVLYDAIHRVTGSTMRIPGVPAGTRAAALPDAGVSSPDGFLTNLGRPARESACECERTNSLQLGPVMALISGPTVENAISDPQNDLAKLVAKETNDVRLVEQLFLRILSRPASKSEVDRAMSVLQNIPAEHAALLKQHADYAQQLAPKMAQQEQQRQDAIARARSALEGYEREIAAREADLDREHAEGICQAERELQEEEPRLAQRFEQWAKQARQPVVWTALDPIDLSSTNGTQLTRQDDLSVWATGPNGKTTYQFTARTELTSITGIQLEVFADERLPKKGPGRAPNGNYVLTEFRVEWAPENDPAKASPVALQNAQADFSQKKYDVSTAIDGKKAPQENGWATSPKTGENRTAVFETRDRPGTEPGRITVFLDQEFADGQHTIGRFRISLTNSPRPVTLKGLPKNIAEILAVAPDERTAGQRDELSRYYRGLDAEWKKREEALAKAKIPRPVDPKLQTLRDQLAEVSKPLPIDPKLAQLRRDVELSTQQMEHIRLTFAQDLAWALINSPAFLFNR